MIAHGWHMKKKSTIKIIGRDKEKSILRDILSSNKPEFLAIYGRRRVGKTFLIRNYFSQSSCLFFHVTGIQNGPLNEQIEQFYKQIGLTFYSGVSLLPKNRWIDAFEDLTKAFETTKQKNIILFFDEFPWMATKRSGILRALEYYWNRFWGNDSRIKIVICGSSASWVIDKIINNKGGLYNRVTRTMKLDPFTLKESREFLEYSGIHLNNRHVLDLYMIMGGIPHYLALVKKGLSAHQCIDDLFFQKNGALVDEFDRLFASLFNESETYIDLIRIIAKHRYGISQSELISESGMTKGGRFSQRIKELEEAGFVISFIPYGHHEKGIFFKIADEYTIFYLSWVEKTLKSIKRQDKSQGYWLSKTQSSSWKSWSGYAFEAICFKHLHQIRLALNIDPGAEAGTWRYVARNQSNKKGCQIDLLFDRQDQSITICEIKYCERQYCIDKLEANNLIDKVEAFRTYTRSHKQIFIAIIACGGIKQNKYSKEIISQNISMNDLFKI